MVYDQTLSGHHGLEYKNRTHVGAGVAELCRCSVRTVEGGNSYGASQGHEGKEGASALELGQVWEERNKTHS